MKNSIFTKIIKGDIPCHKVYEDDKTFAFMDIHPMLQGHVLVVPKVQINHLDELLPDDYRALMEVAKLLSQTIRKVFHTSRTVMYVLGFDVEHAHIHLVPTDNTREIVNSFTKISKIANKEPNHEKLAAHSKLIREYLEKQL